MIARYGVERLLRRIILCPSNPVAVHLSTGMPSQYSSAGTTRSHEHLAHQRRPKKIRQPTASRGDPGGGANLRLRSLHAAASRNRAALAAKADAQPPFVQREMGEGWRGSSARSSQWRITSPPYLGGPPHDRHAKEVPRLRARADDKEMYS